jgi:hypothetical protein
VRQFIELAVNMPEHDPHVGHAERSICKDSSSLTFGSAAATMASHPRRDLVAVGDAHEAVGAVGVDHVLDGVGNELARREAVEHAAMPHGDAVVDGDGVELAGDGARGCDLVGDQLAQVLEVDVAGNELRERVGDGDDRLAEVTVGHAGRTPQGACACHVASVSCRP